LRHLDVDDLRPEIAGNIDLRRRRAASRLLDDAVQHFGHSRRIADFFLAHSSIGAGDVGVRRIARQIRQLV